MLETNYEEYKKQTFAAYEEFKQVLDKLPPLPPEEKLDRDVDLALVEKEVEKIRRNKFTLMVVGEAKSGKSTFINAYLKSDILPVSVEQCTSAIIIISYSENELLTYWTGDERKFEISGHEAVRSFLNQNAARPKQYRKIPVAFLNDLLVARKGNIKEKEIDEIIKRLMKEENIHDLSEQEYRDSIWEYLKEGKKHWHEIVSRIEIQYPFAKEMKDVRIVDSPGVNSLGFLEKLTEKSIQNANAIVFIKYLRGQDVESKPFHLFLKSKHAGLHKDSLFLFLSGAGDVQEEQKDTLVKNARQTFPEIKEDMIIPIDSLVQTYINRFEGKTDSEIDAIVRQERSEKKMYYRISDEWAYKNNVDEFFANMKALSGFQEIGVLFEMYARKAQRLALIQLLELLNGFYGKILARIDQRIDLKTKQKETSEAEWIRFLEDRKKSLAELQNQINVKLLDIEGKYTGENGIVAQKKDEKVKAVQAAIENETDYLSFEKKIADITAPLRKLKEECYTKVIEDCNAVLKAQCEKQEFKDWQTKILVQTVSPEEVAEKVRQEQDDPNSDSHDTKKKEDCGSVTRYREFNSEKCLKELKKYINSRVNAIATDTQAEAVKYIAEISGKYKEKLKAMIESEQKSLDNAKKDWGQSEDELNRCLGELKTARTNAQGKQKILEKLLNELNEVRNAAGC